MIAGRALLGAACTDCARVRLLGIRLRQPHAVGGQGHSAQPAKPDAPACCLPPLHCGAVAWARVTLLCRIWADVMGVSLVGTWE